MNLQVVKVPERPTADLPPMRIQEAVLLRLWGLAEQAVLASRPATLPARPVGPARRPESVRYAND